MIDRTQEDVIKTWKITDSGKPLVSIQCCTYNQEKYIAKALDGFLIQCTNFQFEVVVHDDASTDKTADIIREYEKKYPLIIKPIYETENQYSKKDDTLSRIMQEASRGRYIAFCEGDDYWIDENKLQYQFDLMEKNPNYKICFCKVRCVDLDGKELNRTMPPTGDFFKTGVVSLRELIHIQFGESLWPLQTSSYFCVSKDYSDYLNNKPKCYSLFPFGDMPLMLYFLSLGNGGYINKEMSCYRMLAGGFMSNLKNNNDFSIQVSKNLITALQAFDEETKFDYHDDLQVRVSKEQYNIANIEGDFKSLVEKENKLFFKNMPLKFRINTYLKAYFPGMKYLILLKRKIQK